MTWAGSGDCPLMMCPGDELAGLHRLRCPDSEHSSSARRDRFSCPGLHGLGSRQVSQAPRRDRPRGRPPGATDNAGIGPPASSRACGPSSQGRFRPRTSPAPSIQSDQAKGPVLGWEKSGECYRAIPRFSPQGPRRAFGFRLRPPLRRRRLRRSPRAAAGRSGAGGDELRRERSLRSC